MKLNGPKIKDLYKALVRISEITHDNEISLEFAHKSLELASTTAGRIAKTDIQLTEQFNELNRSAFNWLMESQKQYKVKDFGSIFERYINN